jgi:homoserine kinase
LCLQGVGDEGGGTWPSVKVPPRIRSVLVHPDLVVETKAARSILKPQVFLTEHVRQSALLAGFLTGCATGDLSLISHSLVDLIIEPQRQALIPGFDLAKAAALKAGALGCSISGSGPSLFAWAVGDAAAKKVARAMVAVFESAGLECESWCAPVPPAGARVVGRGKGVPK